MRLASSRRSLNTQPAQKVLSRSFEDNTQFDNQPPFLLPKRLSCLPPPLPFSECSLNTSKLGTNGEYDSFGSSYCPASNKKEAGEEAKASQRHTVGCFQLQRRKRIWLELKAAHPHPEMGSFSSYRRLSAVVWWLCASQVGVSLCQISLFTKDGICRCYFSIREELC